MAVGDVYRLTRKVILNGAAHYNVIHFIQSQPVTGDPEVALAAAWDSTTGPSSPEARVRLLQRGHDSLIRQAIDVQRISPTEGEIYSFGFATGTPPTVTTGLPNYCSVKIVINTTRNDRSGKGGFYISGIAEGDTTENNMTSGAQTSYLVPLLTALLAYFDPASATYSGFAIGVLSRLLNEFNTAESIQASTILGTTNSRKAGRGI